MHVFANACICARELGFFQTIAYTLTKVSYNNLERNVCNINIDTKMCLHPDNL